MDEEHSFPRGRAAGSHASTSSGYEERKQPRRAKRGRASSEGDAGADGAAGGEQGSFSRGKAEIGFVKGRGGKKKARRSSSGGSGLLDASLSELRTGSSVSRVDPLRLSAVRLGAKVWACVIGVTGARATLALPHGLRGVIEYNASSNKGGREHADEPQRFQVGQLLRCVVTRREQEKKRVTLTASLEALHEGGDFAKLLTPGEIVPALVESEEDHGWTLSFGLASASNGRAGGKSPSSRRKSGAGAGKVKGFLPKHGAAGAMASAVQEKAVVDVAVTSVDKRGVVQCSRDKTLLATQIARSHKDLSLHDLVPGMLVKAAVKSVLAGGLVVSFMSYFTATIEAAHLPKLVSDYKPGGKVQARVLYIDPESKTVCLSALGHLLSLDEGNLLDALPKMGSVLEEAVVVGVDDTQGLLLKAEHEGRAVDAFCHSSNVADKKGKGKGAGKGADSGEEEAVSKRFAKGQEVSGRVIGYRPMENVVNVTLKESVMGQQILSHEDVAPGSLLTGTVAAVRDFGLIIQIAKNVRGVCPKMHMSDVTSAEPNWGKFKVNAKVKCLVLDCDYARQRITLSLKRSLVKSELPRIASLDVRLQDSLSHGVVTGVQPFGLFVLFCGGVKGLAHVSELGLSANETPEACFDVGQVVKCRVIGVRKQKQQLVLSLQVRRPAPITHTHTHTLSLFLPLSLSLFGQ